MHVSSSCCNIFKMKKTIFPYAPAIAMVDGLIKKDNSNISAINRMRAIMLLSQDIPNNDNTIDMSAVLLSIAGKILHNELSSTEAIENELMKHETLKAWYLS